MNETLWPDIPYKPWRETCSALHMYSQIVGKYRLAREPWVNHSWHATLYVNARGFTTGLVPDRPGGVEIAFDLVDHALIGTVTNGRTARFELQPMSVAEFHSQFLEMLKELGATAEIHGAPNEVPDPVPFAEDVEKRPYDPDAVNRFFRATASIAHVFEQFRTSYLGKVSPVHLFWGSFDLAVTRFSGREAPLHPGGFPALPDEVTREAYSHEVSSAGFWPGGGGIDAPTFYSYAYPTPDGFAEVQIKPEQAYFEKDLGEFVLPYDAVRKAADPQGHLLAFLESTYDAAARLGDWDRAALECAPGKPRVPREV